MDPRRDFEKLFHVSVTSIMSGRLGEARYFRERQLSTYLGGW